MARPGQAIVLRRTSDQGYITAPHLVAFYDTLGRRRTYSRLKPPAFPRGDKALYTYSRSIALILMQATIYREKKDEMHDTKLTRLIFWIKIAQNSTIKTE